MRSLLLPLAVLLSVTAGASVAAEPPRLPDVGSRPTVFPVEQVMPTGTRKLPSEALFRDIGSKRPTVVIFAPKLTGDVRRLVQSIDKIVLQNKKRDMVAAVVLLTDDTKGAVNTAINELRNELRAIRNVSMTFYRGTRGPRDYRLNPDAVTVLMWVRSRVEVNHTVVRDPRSRQYPLDEKRVKIIANDTFRILR